MKQTSLILALLTQLIFSNLVHAVVVEDLFTIELPVADQTTSMRLDVFNEGFKQIIIKVSGSAEILQHEGFKRPLENSSRYVHQFRYIVRKGEQEDAFDGGQLFLRVVFNQDLVEKLMRENNISVWGKERPSTLLLISFDVNKNATLVSSDTTAELVEEIDSQARLQGLPVLFPLLDLEDRMILGINDVINVNENNIDALAARYAPDAILTGQVIGRIGKGWKGSWQARFSNRVFSWNYQGSSRQDVLHQAIAQLAKTLASEYALQSYQAFEQSVLFSVDQVAGISDHIRVQSYLQSLDAVEFARLVLIDEDKVTYRIKLRNTAEDLHRLITLGYVLEQLDLPQINAATDDQTVIMNYRLMR